VDDEEVRRRVRERAEGVVHEFPNPKFWASGLGIGSLRHMAETVDMAWHYTAIYWMGSQSTHATSIAVDEFLLVTEQKQPVYQIGLSTRHVRTELAAASDALIRGLMFLNESFALGADAALAKLCTRYSEVFGIDAQMGG
jgi:hypothetical protein